VAGAGQLPAVHGNGTMVNMAVQHLLHRPGVDAVPHHGMRQRGVAVAITSARSAMGS
jgi:hypothetical protein